MRRQSFSEQLYSWRWLSTENRYSPYTSSKKSPTRGKTANSACPARSWPAPGRCSAAWPLATRPQTLACWLAVVLRAANVHVPHMPKVHATAKLHSPPIRRMNTQYLVSRPMTLVDKLAYSMQSCNSDGRSDLSKVKSRVKSTHSRCFSSWKYAQRPRLELESNCRARWSNT